MARSQIGKLKLTVTKLERKRGKMVKHIEKSIAAIAYIDKVIATYKEAINMSDEPEPIAVPQEEHTGAEHTTTGGAHENVVSNS